MLAINSTGGEGIADVVYCNKYVLVYGFQADGSDQWAVVEARMAARKLRVLVPDRWLPRALRVERGAAASSR